MQLLDAIIAFALTMAALATVVTVIMEAGLRIARMRKKNFIEVMKLLNTELGKGKLNLTPEDRWDFFVKVVRNPAEAAADSLAINGQKLLQNIGSNQEKLKKIESRIAAFGRDKAAGTKLLIRVGRFLKQLIRGDKNRAALYETVSLEYMLRCLAETASVKHVINQTNNKLAVEFNRIARKYEELGSSVSASFKHHAHYWSILIGIIIAIAANVHGLRIFEAYRIDPKLAASVIEQQANYTENYQKVQASLKDFDKEYATLKKDIKTKRAEIEAIKDKDSEDDALKGKEEDLSNLEAELDKLTALKNIQETAQRAQQQVADLMSLGVPLGWEFYPGCPYGGSEKDWDQSSPMCKAIPETGRESNSWLGWFEGDLTNTLLNDFASFLNWLFVVIVTGILIGLGAPFWFDIAKRLSAVRKGLQNASASSEYRLSAKNANGDPVERKKIVDSVLEQAAAEA